MVIAFVRHAHAGSRSAWTEDDRDRPLSEKGRAQAKSLVSLLHSSSVTALISSPYLRCIQTLEPLAEASGIPVTLDDRLAEDTAFEITLSLLEHLDEGTVLCSHGDVIPATVDALVRRGLILVASRRWTIHPCGLSAATDDRLVVTYLSRPHSPDQQPL